jgi:hypothetical protein
MKFTDIFEKVIATVELVEQKKEEFSSSESKKEYAVNAIDALIDIPVLPDKLVIGFVVDLTVFLFNKYGIFKK